MIVDFDKVRKQLKELSEVINAFKSEAVQLRIVELIFGMHSDEEAASDHEESNDKSRKRSVRKRKVPAKKPRKPAVNKKKAPVAGSGAYGTVAKLAETEFFSKPKTIQDIIKHCETNLARKFKANEFSGKLARMVRDGTLTRKKNSDNQYEYTKK